MRAMLQERASEQGMEDDEDTSNGDDKACTKLLSLQDQRTLTTNSMGNCFSRASSF